MNWYWTTWTPRKTTKEMCPLKIHDWKMYRYVVFPFEILPNLGDMRHVFGGVVFFVFLQDECVCFTLQALFCAIIAICFSYSTGYKHGFDFTSRMKHTAPIKSTKVRDGTSKEHMSQKLKEPSLHLPQTCILSTFPSSGQILILYINLKPIERSQLLQQPRPRGVGNPWVFQQLLQARIADS